MMNLKLRCQTAKSYFSFMPRDQQGLLAGALLSFIQDPDGQSNPHLEPHRLSTGGKGSPGRSLFGSYMLWPGNDIYHLHSHIAGQNQSHPTRGKKLQFYLIQGKQRDRSTERGLEEIMANLKRKEILTHVPTGMNFEDIILSETSQSQKDKHYVITVT